ncbi:serine--tRNA ligase [Microscilla marina]|uniref:Serine--tRNA ligase n=1 Tax=Microscilla marina ATCC 23134 TaxID=313606 RepID=A1ZTU9_MICM2|nr:serine--tRNA ligase [Microscilla marina]EAY26201.1 seryl-tRNA synthetase [Microscilla marina ATCC 23134]
MLQIPHIRTHQQKVIEGLQKRGVKNAEDLVDQVLEYDTQRKNTQTKLDNLKASSNNQAKRIGQLMKQGKKVEADKLKQQVGGSKQEVKDLEAKLKIVSNKRDEVLYKLPNIPHPSVPKGNTDADNKVESEHGSVPTLHDKAVPHWDLIKQYDIIDFEVGTKITGAGFPVYKGKGARLQRALINFFLDEAVNAGYSEVIPPYLVNQDSGFGTGQLPDKDGQMYHAQEDGLYLIPTAEVPITNMYRDVIVEETDLPIKHVGYTPCFRREAGAWGAQVRGLNRLHQFDKVEIVQIQHPEKSYETLNEMCTHVQGLLQKLDLPYRVLRLCSGDLGFTSALTFDMEVYSAAQKRWLEVSSVSNFETFQANRMKLRYRTGDNKKHFTHTLNGSALALPRIVAALLENNQTPEGIKVPAVLQPYTGFDIIN